MDTPGFGMVSILLNYIRPPINWVTTLPKTITFNELKKTTTNHLTERQIRVIFLRGFARMLNKLWQISAGTVDWIMVERVEETAIT